MKTPSFLKLTTLQSLCSSITFRIGATLLIIIMIAELIAGLIWYQSSAKKEVENLHKTIVSLMSNAADTYNYFHALPVNYRYLILNQIREMGGTRFFISINQHQLSVVPPANNARTDILLSAAHDVLNKKISHAEQVTISLSRRQDLRVFNSGIKLDALPEIWAGYSLALGDMDLPIVVMQIQMSEQEWFYLAATLPVPFSALSPQFIDQKQLMFLGISSLLLVLCTVWLLRLEIRPIRRLAKAATLMSGQLYVQEVKEEGSKETRTAVRAFNKMNRRVRAYIRDREMLFGAISHDLKTPLACLKLRTEMLDDEQAKARFEKILDEFDLMLKGALQCIRDTDIHEEPEWIDVTQMIEQCASYYNRNTARVQFSPGAPVHYLGKPLAVKRCLYNIVDNGVKYGEKVDIELKSTTDSILLTFRDYGPGLDKKWTEKVFEPYFRVNPQDELGSGLGLTISRSIARSHGGDLTLQNHPVQGLMVHIQLMRDQ
ncbi:sensor histidine kinase [Photobacterium halotolerans]|uniref:sensor histidine kinase n=1 Tax=Photobacterium halotolerans TaxID=265726 RepID=UPI001372546C|nr:HAMP domain-containing sensor histidine kinase [Photobacterium halotolerans]NAW85224.1 two-component sensor histidine kinase [Photobacterium halotolerans]